MKGLIFGVMAILVFSLGFWAYRENYATQAEIKELRQVRLQIAAAEARLDRLRAEWAYLNRPDRLLAPAELNFGRLELLPLTGAAFADIEDVPLPFQGPPLPPASAMPPLSSYIASSSNSSEEPL